MNLIRTCTALFAIGYGLLIWFEATIMIRWLGEWIFLPESTAFTIALFAATVVVVYTVGWCFFYMFASFASDVPWKDCDHDWNSPSKHVAMAHILWPTRSLHFTT